MKTEKIKLSLGQFFTIKVDECVGIPGYFTTRRLIFRRGRPIGHWTTESRFSSPGYLWLQNYAGYLKSDFFIQFSSVEVALERACKILENWDADPRRPTWGC